MFKTAAIYSLHFLMYPSLAIVYLLIQEISCYIVLRFAERPLTSFSSFISCESPQHVVDRLQVWWYSVIKLDTVRTNINIYFRFYHIFSILICLGSTCHSFYWLVCQSHSSSTWLHLQFFCSQVHNEELCKWELI